MVAEPVHMGCVCHTLTGLDGNWNSQWAIWAKHHHLCVRHEDTGLVTKMLYIHTEHYLTLGYSTCKSLFMSPLKKQSLLCTQYLNSLLCTFHYQCHLHNTDEFVMTYGCVCVFGCVPRIGMEWLEPYSTPVVCCSLLTLGSKGQGSGLGSRCRFVSPESAHLF